MKQNFGDILERIEAERRSKLAQKLPSWGAVEGIEVAGKLAMEQCSSEQAALYKASIAESLGASTIADLTSGLGVDVWAFAGIAGKVFYNDMQPSLCLAAEKNFRLLGRDNIEVSCMQASERLESLGSVDMIYLDPARRDGVGKKVFLLEDCSPNLPEMLPAIWKHTSTLMVKLSPMADISLISKQLPGVTEIHSIGASGECKELLCVVRKDYEGPFAIIVAELGKAAIRFESSENLPVKLADCIKPGDTLLEPGAALMKTGLFGAICERFGISQLDTSSHLYTGSATGAEHFFKVFEIIEVAGYGKQQFRELGMRYPKADVTARNLPIRSEDLKKKMGIAGSGDTHIFGLTVRGQKTLLVCRRK